MIRIVSHTCLVILIIVSSVSCKIYKKCCTLNEGLILSSNVTYECSPKFKKYVEPLRIKELNNISFEISGNFDETCIDKTVDGKNILTLTSNMRRKNLKVELPTIFKCCPWDMIYDESKKACVNGLIFDKSAIFDTSAAIYDIVIGGPFCKQDEALTDIIYTGNFTINNGTLIINSTIYDNGKYCIDKNIITSKIYIRACKYKMDVCRNNACVPKCCPPGQIYYKPSEMSSTQCIEGFEIPFYSNFTLENEQRGIPLNMGILQTKKCRQYQVPKIKINEKGTLIMNDSLYFEGINQNFCLEYHKNFRTYIGLLCFPKNKTNGLQSFFYLAGLIISIIFLAITLTIYFFLPELQNLHGRTVMSHAAALLASYIILTMVKKPVTSYPPQTCLILANGIMYTFLVAFAWLNIMCFDIWYTFGVVKARGIKKNKDLKKFLLYSLYAYGLPLIITGITLYVDLFSDIDTKYKPNFAKNVCWFDLRDEKQHWPYTIFFSIPVGIIIFFNIVLFILTVKNCLKVKGEIQRMQHLDSPKKRKFFTDKATVIMNFKLFIVMGISWMFELMSAYIRQPAWLWYCLDVINVLQGLWIFFIFVLKDKVWKALKKKLGYTVLREGSQTQTSVLSTKNSMCSTTSIKLNEMSKQDENKLLKNAIRNSIDINERQNF